MENNVGKIERWGSLVGGGALLAYTLLRRNRRRRRLSPLSGSLALGAATLLFRGATGHCPGYGALGLNTADLADDWARPLSRPAQQEDKAGETGDKTFRGKWPLPEGARLVQPGARDVVDDASAHSFPASDPPALTPTEVG